MEQVTFWTLADDDQPLIDRVAAGTGSDAARVLAYLLLREEQAGAGDEAATRLAVRVGTGMKRKTVTDALTALEDAGLVTRTSVPSGTRGRPPDGWEAAMDRGDAVEQVFRVHAAELLDQAADIADVPREASAAPDEAVSLDVALNWQPNALHLPLYAARCDNAYSEREIEVSFDHHTGSQSALDAVLAGDADVGLVGAGTVVRAWTADAPVVPIAVLYQRSTAVLYTTRQRFGERFERIDQLTGHRVVTAASAETSVLLQLLLDRLGIRDDVRVTAVDGEERETLLSGQADVATGSFADARELQDRGKTVDMVPLHEHYPVYGPTLVVSSDTIADGAGTLQRFLAGTTAGWAGARQHPGPAAEAIAAQCGASVDDIRHRFRHAADTCGVNQTVHDRGWGWIRHDHWQRLATAARESGVADTTGSPEQVS